MIEEQKQKIAVKVASNYEKRISKLIRDSRCSLTGLRIIQESQSVDCKGSKINTKNGFAYMGYSDIHLKKITINRGNLYAVEQEVNVLKELGLYKGHYIAKDSNDLFLLQQAFSENWHDLQHERKDSRPSNLADLVHNNIIKITSKICEQLSNLYDIGYYHNDLNNAGNILVKTTGDLNDIADVKVIDFDLASSVNDFPITSNNSPPGSVYMVNPVFLGRELKSEKEYENFLVSAGMIERNKITDANDLFLLLVKNIKKGNKNEDLVREVKKTIIKEYLLKLDLGSPKDKEIVHLQSIIEPAICVDESVIFLKSRQALASFQNQLKTRVELMHHIVEYASFRDVLEECVNEIKKYTVILPHKNVLGVTSNSLVDIVQFDFYGFEKLCDVVFDISKRECYNQSNLGLLWKTNIISAELLLEGHLLNLPSLAKNNPVLTKEIPQENKSSLPGLFDSVVTMSPVKSQEISALLHDDKTSIYLDTSSDTFSDISSDISSDLSSMIINDYFEAPRP